MENLQKLIFTKVKALEIALITLIREQPDQEAYWARLEKFSAATLGDKELIDLPHLVDAVQHQLDEWRHSNGPDPSQRYMPHPDQ